MEVPPSSERGGDKRGLGEQAQGWGLRRQRLGRLHHGLGSAPCHPPHSGHR